MGTTESAIAANRAELERMRQNIATTLQSVHAQTKEAIEDTTYELHRLVIAEIDSGSPGSGRIYRKPITPGQRRRLHEKGRKRRQALSQDQMAKVIARRVQKKPALARMRRRRGRR